MDKIKTSVSLNLSNQANTFSSKNSHLFQFNYFVILGLDFLDTEITDAEGTPVSVSINKAGEISLSGPDGEIVNDQNTCIYTDRKVTSSEP